MSSVYTVIPVLRLTNKMQSKFTMSDRLIHCIPHVKTEKEGKRGIVTKQTAEDLQITRVIMWTAENLSVLISSEHMKRAIRSVLISLSIFLQVKRIWPTTALRFSRPPQISEDCPCLEAFLSFSLFVPFSPLFLFYLIVYIQMNSCMCTVYGTLRTSVTSIKRQL